MSDDATPNGKLALVAVVLRARDPDALATFYRRAFDFVDAGSAVTSAVASPAASTTATNDAMRLVLGTTHLWIEPTDPDVVPLTRSETDVPGWSTRFQHFALRVADMHAAMARLDAVDGWRPISIGGPQRLPANTGGVTAFKFRDPEGHPLEFLMLPDRRTGPLFAGIDHSAISVVDVERSVAFYEALGFGVKARTLNTGIEQQRLDAIDGATVDVVALRTPSGTAPHVELLGYRGVFDRNASVGAASGDVLATRLVFADIGPAGRRPESAMEVRRDPDGHLLEIG